MTANVSHSTRPARIAAAAAVVCVATACASPDAGRDPADPMAALYGATATVSFGDAPPFVWYFDPNGRFSTEDGTTGAWSRDGDTLCMDASDGDEACMTIEGGPPRIGAPFQLVSERGALTVVLSEGRP